MEKIEISDRDNLSKDEVPCVIYNKLFNKLGKVKSQDFDKLVKRKNMFLRSTIFLADIDGQPRQVTVKSVHFHPVTDKVLHVDFFLIPDDGNVKITVPVIVTNRDKCQAVKEGAIVKVIKKRVEVKCNTKNFIEKLEIDISNCRKGQIIRIKDLIEGSNSIDPLVSIG